MKGLTSLSIVAAVLAFATAGCGSTSYGPSGKPGVSGAANSATIGQDSSQQPVQGGLKKAAYTAAHNSCSLYSLAELARQNGVKATPEAVAKVYATGESTPAGKKQAYQGCLDAINGK